MAVSPQSQAVVLMGRALHVSAFQTWPNGGGVVHTAACVHPTVVVEPCAVIHDAASIGADSVVGATSVIGPSVRIGRGTRLAYGVHLANCTIGEECLLHSGVCIGADGFGFDVARDGRVSKRPQDRQVHIGNHVEIGANSCIDRGSWRDTIIGSHTKLDNLVQVGHNAHVGAHCLLCGHVALGGSSTLGDHVIMGGKSAVRDHVRVAAGVRVAAKAGVARHIDSPGDYAGYPAVPAAQWKRHVLSALRRARGSSKNEATSRPSSSPDDDSVC